MSETASPQPSPEQLAAFRAGDPVAIADVIELVLPLLSRMACRQYYALPQEDVLEEIFQVLAEISRHYERYDPARASFTTYAYGLIGRRLKDVYERWQKQTSHEELGPGVREKLLALPYNESEESDVAILLTRNDFFQQLGPYLTQSEQEICDVMRTTDDPNMIAEVLARHGDKSEVKNARAKLKRKLANIAAQLNYRVEDLL